MKVPYFETWKRYAKSSTADPRWFLIKRNASCSKLYQNQAIIYGLGRSSDFGSNNKQF